MVVKENLTYVAPAMNTSPVFALVRMESSVINRAEETTIKTILAAVPSMALIMTTGTRRSTTTNDAISDRANRFRAHPEKM